MLLGAHMSIAGGIFNAVLDGEKAGCDVIQIFTKQSNQWKAKPLTDEEITRFFDEQKRSKVKVVCAHTSYLINLGSPDDELYQKSIEAFRIEMERCDVLKIPHLVMHPGSHVGSGEEAGLRRIADAFNRILGELPDGKTSICIESTAGQGTNLGYKFEQLARIINMVENKDCVSVCLDTCHIFAAGYRLQDAKDYRATMKEFDDIVGLKRLQVIHFNDSKKPFGSKKDRHEHIGEGELGLEPFRNIMNDRRLGRVPKILETPKSDDLHEDIENLKILRSLVDEKD
ncbi:MAG: deoxyribonuclease IV [Candidatus Zixiibacteriota bacterium]